MTLGRLSAGDTWRDESSSPVTLAAARVTAAAGTPFALEAVTVTVLAVALGWYAVLVGYEIVRPRLSYDGRRWSTVFPLGMTATSAMTAGRVCGVPWLGTLGKLLLWPAVIAWLVVGFGALWQARRQWPIRSDGLSTPG